MITPHWVGDKIAGSVLHPGPFSSTIFMISGEGPGDEVGKLASYGLENFRQSRRAVDFRTHEQKKRNKFSLKTIDRNTT